MRKPKVIFCDLDGTLLINGNITVSDEAHGLIGRLAQEGILFSTSSGRQYANLRRLFSPEADDIAYLCENGCLCMYQGRELVRHELERGLAMRMVDAIQAEDGYEVMVSSPAIEYIQPKDPDFLRVLRDVVLVDVEQVEDLHALDVPILKVAAYGNTEDLGEDFWRPRFGDEASVQTSGTLWLDMAPKGVNKGVAAAGMLEALGIDPADCICFGDNHNDVQIMELVGCPIAMEHSTLDVLGIARYTTPTVEAALARILDGEGYDW